VDDHKTTNLWGEHKHHDHRDQPVDGGSLRGQVGGAGGTRLLNGAQNPEGGGGDAKWSDRRDSVNACNEHEPLGRVSWQQGLIGQ